MRQITLAALFSGWSHVLHAVFKPWGTSLTYYVQHLSLFTTTFIFIMGLLLKVNGVQQESLGFRILSGIMLLLCVVFALVWLTAMVRGVGLTMARKSAVRKERRLRAALSDADGDGDGDGENGRAGAASQETRGGAGGKARVALRSGSKRRSNSIFAVLSNPLHTLASAALVMPVEESFDHMDSATPAPRQPAALLPASSTAASATSTTASGASCGHDGNAVSNSATNPTIRGGARMLGAPHETLSTSLPGLDSGLDGGRPSRLQHSLEAMTVKVNPLVAIGQFRAHVLTRATSVRSQGSLSSSTPAAVVSLPVHGHEHHDSDGPARPSVSDGDATVSEPAFATSSRAARALMLQGRQSRSGARLAAGTSGASLPLPPPPAVPPPPLAHDVEATAMSLKFFKRTTHRPFGAKS